MPETNFETGQSIDSAPAQQDFDSVCICAPRIYDSCGAKDCLSDLPVFFTAESQAIVDTAASVKINKASVLTSTVEVDSVAFHRGFFSVDMVFYFSVCVDVYNGTGGIPTTLNGLAMYGKRVVLYGSDGNVRSFSSDDSGELDVLSLEHCNMKAPESLPKATVSITSPMALSARLTPVNIPTSLSFPVPEGVSDYFGSELVLPTNACVQVTLGIFTITRLQRDVQLMIPSYDFCVPRSECASRTDDPCEAFSKIEFPTDSFFPPNSIEGGELSSAMPERGCCG